MNQELLKKHAENLDQLLRRYAQHDFEAAQLLSALSNLIADAVAEKITGPMEWAAVPGDYFFDEGHLRKYGDLESAYAKFKIEVTGGERPALRLLRAQMGEG